MKINKYLIFYCIDIDYKYMLISQYDIKKDINNNLKEEKKIKKIHNKKH